MKSLPAVLDGHPIGLAVAATRRPAARSIATCVMPVPVRSLITMLSAPPAAAIRTCSTPLRSIVTLPTSRNSRARLPLAERLMFSEASEPLKTSVSVPASPSTMSLPSPGSQIRSSPLPSVGPIVADGRL